MTKTTKLSFSFAIKLLMTIAPLYFIQAGIYFQFNPEWGTHLITEAYLTNYLLVIFTFPLLLFVKQKNNQAVGFTFLGGFFLKLILFMIFFNPIYKADQVVETAEFLAFFAPYSICLAFETLSLVRLLNRS